MSIPGLLEELREWIYSCIRIILFKICLPSTKNVLSGEIREGRRGFSLLTMILDMIL
jgi:hypothetical protein